MSALRVSVLVLCVSASGAAGAVDLPGPVVSPAWLAEHRDAVVVLDVRSDLDAFTAAPEYETDAKTGAQKLVAAGGHIAGARLIDFNQTRVARMVGEVKIDKMLPSRAEVQALVRAAGVGDDDVLVITSVGEASDEVDMAARLYWTLKSYGETDLALLDGGNVAWIAAGQPVSTEPMGEVAAGDWTARELDRRWLAEIDDIKPADGGAPQLVDARPAPQYHGIYYKKPAVTAGGHVEGAVNFPIDLQTRQVGLAQTFMQAEQYRTLLKTVGIEPQPGAISYCNTGHMAAGAWFVLSEIMGIEGVRLYDGSMHEWTTLGRPVVGVGF
ncbi:MAG: sulfurtransferase [Rhodanobacteraceae bacterium]|nr:sulfurtransferase [Rhodanobacteraceae bacterium]